MFSFGKCNSLNRSQETVEPSSFWSSGSNGYALSSFTHLFWNTHQDRDTSVKKPFVQEKSGKDHDCAILTMLQRDYGKKGTVNKGTSSLEEELSLQGFQVTSRKVKNLHSLREFIITQNEGACVSAIVQKGENEGRILVDHVTSDLRNVEVRDPSAMAPTRLSNKAFLKIWNPSKLVTSVQSPDAYARRVWDSKFQGWDYSKCTPKNLLRTSSETLLSEAIKSPSLTEGWNRVISTSNELSLDAPLETLDPKVQWRPDQKTDLQLLIDRQKPSNHDPSVLIMPWGNTWVVVLEANDETVEYLNPEKSNSENLQEDVRSYLEKWKRCLLYTRKGHQSVLRGEKDPLKWIPKSPWKRGKKYCSSNASSPKAKIFSHSL